MNYWVIYICVTDSLPTLFIFVFILKFITVSSRLTPWSLPLLLMSLSGNKIRNRNMHKIIINHQQIVHPLIYWSVYNFYRSYLAQYVASWISYLRFWYQVFTCVSLRFSLFASSIRSWTLRYFCRSKLFSSVCSWWSVNAVRAFLCFLLSPLIPSRTSESSLAPEMKWYKTTREWENDR